MADGKKALITGATGQDGAYLGEFLLSKGYEVPAGLAQQCCDLAIAVAAILAGQFDHICRQLLGIGPAPRRLALRQAVLSERRTGATLGHLQMNANMLDAGATTRRR